MRYRTAYNITYQGICNFDFGIVRQPSISKISLVSSLLTFIISRFNLLNSLRKKRTKNYLNLPRNIFMISQFCCASSCAKNRKKERFFSVWAKIHQYNFYFFQNILSIFWKICLARRTDMPQTYYEQAWQKCSQ